METLICINLSGEIRRRISGMDRVSIICNLSSMLGLRSFITGQAATRSSLSSFVNASVIHGDEANSPNSSHGYMSALYSSLMSLYDPRPKEPWMALSMPDPEAQILTVWPWVFNELITIFRRSHSPSAFRDTCPLKAHLCEFFKFIGICLISDQRGRHPGPSVIVFGCLIIR